MQPLEPPPDAPIPPGDEWTFSRVLALMDEQRRTGVLVVTHDDGETKLHVRQGHIVHVERQRGGDGWLLGEFLVQTGTLRPTDILSASKEGDRRGVRVEDVLVERQLVSEDVLKRFANLEVAELLFPLFRSKDLGIRFVEERPRRPEHVTPLPVSYVLKEAERRAEVFPKLRQRVGRSTSVYEKDTSVMAELLGYAEPDPHLDAPLPELSADARIVYFYIDGSKSVEQVARSSGLGLFETYRAFAGLLDQYLLTLVTTHGRGKRVTDRVSVIPRFVSLLTYVGLAALLYFGVQWGLANRDLLEASVTASSPRIDAKVSDARIARIRQSLRLYELAHGSYPKSLDALAEAGYVGRDARSVLGSLGYRVDAGMAVLEVPLDLARGADAEESVPMPAETPP